MLLRRYQRFLADVQLPNGEVITIYCPNTGSMRHCLFINSPVWYSTSDNPKRKYAHTWELMQTPDHEMIGVHSQRANALAVEAIEQGVITELQGYQHLATEVKYGQQNSRIDILLRDNAGGACYVEVKSCTLKDEHSKQGYFPDAVSTRAHKHIQELIEMVEQGQRGVLLFVVQHTGIDCVAPAAHIDPIYAELCSRAKQLGVEFLAYRAEITPQSCRLVAPCPVIIAPCDADPI